LEQFDIVSIDVSFLLPYPCHPPYFDIQFPPFLALSSSSSTGGSFLLFLSTLPQKMLFSRYPPSIQRSFFPAPFGCGSVPQMRWCFLYLFNESFLPRKGFPTFFPFHKILQASSLLSVSYSMPRPKCHMFQISCRNCPLSLQFRDFPFKDFVKLLTGFFP